MSKATLERSELVARQRARFADLLARVLADNAFYRDKLAHLSFDPARDPLQDLPLTTRAELEQDQQQHPPYGRNLTFPLERYNHYHQTSGSSGGAPLRVLDSEADWAWWQRCWRVIFGAAGVSAADRVAFPFSFGPFIGFWSAFAGAQALGCLCLPAGGMTTGARLRFMLENAATTVCCTPTYALHMAAVAEADGIDLAAGPVQRLIVAGEPGGNVPAVRARIEAAWGARVYDHAGMTEIGPWGVEFSASPGSLYVLEDEFIAEVLDPASATPVAPGASGELVLTNLGRVGFPLIRYRTGDQVRLTLPEPADGSARAGAPVWACCPGGVLGRIDDMITVRGNNVFPATIENIIREFDQVAEFRVRVSGRPAGLNELEIEIEPAPTATDRRLPERIGKAIHDRLFVRTRVRLVEAGALPRFELKARRVVRE